MYKIGKYILTVLVIVACCRVYCRSPDNIMDGTEKYGRNQLTKERTDIYTKKTKHIRRDINTEIKQNLLSRLDSEIAPLGVAYLLGDKTEFSGLFKDKIKDIGVTHLVVISGMHLAVLIEILSIFLKRMPKAIKTYIVVIFIVAYVKFVGVSASLVRAGLVVFCRLLLSYFGRKADGWRMVIFVGAISLIINPAYLVDIAWQLSMLAYIGVIILYPVIDSFLFEKGNISKRNEEKSKVLQYKNLQYRVMQVVRLLDIRSGIMISIAVSLMCLPLFLYYFGSFSLISIFSTVLLSPILPVIIVSMGIIGFLPGNLYQWCYFLGTLGMIGLKVQVWMIDKLSDVNIWNISVEKNNWKILLLYIPVISLFSFLKKEDIKIGKNNASKQDLMVVGGDKVKDIGTYLVKWKDQINFRNEKRGNKEAKNQTF